MSLATFSGIGAFGYDVGIGVAERGTRAAAADPAQAYVASGPIAGGWAGADYEAGLRGELGWHGVREYEAMMRTPAVGSSFNALRAGVLSGGIGLLPAVKPAAAPATPGPKGAGVGDGVDAEMARIVCEQNRRLLDRWEVPVDLVAWEVMEAMYLGHVMTEVQAADVAGGPDDGMLAVTGLRPLHRGSYNFLLDDAGRVARIGAQAIGGGWREFDPAHFAWLTWDPYRGDPRGRSCFRMAHYHWRMLMDLWPEVNKGWRQFGVPMMYGTTAPGAGMVPEKNPDGTIREGGRAITAERQMSLLMAMLGNGSVVAGPNGSDIKILESGKDSSVVGGAVAILEGQIIRSILLQMRATMEARHGSRADSETGQDILGTLVRFVRKWLERFLRSVLMRQNAWNYGPEIARRLTPLVNLGEHEHQDFAAEVGAVASLLQSGYFQDDQMASLDEKFGFQQRAAGGLRIGPSGPIPRDLPPDPAAEAAPATPDAAPPAKEAA